MRFSRASDRAAPMGIWDPVSTTGLERFSSINESAEAV